MENETSLKKIRQGYYRLSSHFHWDSDRTFISGCEDNKNVKNGGFSGLHGTI